MVKRTRRAGLGKTGLSTELGGVLVGLGAHRLLGLKRLDGGAKDPWRAAPAPPPLRGDRRPQRQRLAARGAVDAMPTGPAAERLVRRGGGGGGCGVAGSAAAAVGSPSNASASWWRAGRIVTA